MHVYSIIESEHFGNPVIEILVDGDIWGSVYGYDENFRFGLIKAKMIIAGMNKIEEFYNSNGKSPPLLEEIGIEDNKYSVLCRCVVHDEFPVKGKIIEKPYLKLIGKYDNIGFGLEKARALLDLEEEIKQFIDKYS